MTDPLGATDLRLTPDVIALLNTITPIDVGRLEAFTVALQVVVDAVAAETRESVLDEVRAAIEQARNEHWQKHLAEHPYSDGKSCPGDYGKHDAYFDAARIVRDLRGGGER